MSTYWLRTIKRHKQVIVIWESCDHDMSLLSVSLIKRISYFGAIWTGALLFEDVNLLYPSQWNKQSHTRCQLLLSACTYTMCCHWLVYFDWPLLFSIKKLTVSYYPNYTEKADMRSCFCYVRGWSRETTCKLVVRLWSEGRTSEKQIESEID